MFDELKPCPFCGSEAHIFVGNGVRVICPECGATTKILRDSLYGNKLSGNATAAVIEAWNKRADDVSGNSIGDSEE